MKNELYLCPYCGVDLMKPEVDIEWHKAQKCAPNAQFEKLSNENPHVSDGMRWHKPKKCVPNAPNTRLISLRYHNTPCCYEEGVYLTKYSRKIPILVFPNNEEARRPKGEFVLEVRYKCRERGCAVRHNMGYKEFTMHISNAHGGLGEMDEQVRKSEIKALLEEIKKTMPNLSNAINISI